MAKKAKPAATDANPKPPTSPTFLQAKRTYFRQSDFPQLSLQDAQKIPAAIMDNFGGTNGSPPDVALALGISPTSSAWPILTGAAIAYGLSEGGC